MGNTHAVTRPECPRVASLILGWKYIIYRYITVAVLEQGCCTTTRGLVLSLWGDLKPRTRYCERAFSSRGYVDEFSPAPV